MFFEHFKNNRMMVRLTAAYGTVYVSATAISCFTVMFLTGIGIDTKDIAMIYTCVAIFNTFFYPSLGYLADSIFPVKRILLALMSAAMLFGAVLLILGGALLPSVILAVLLVVFSQGINNMLDSLTNLAAATHQGITYSVARGMGSFTSSFAAVAIGEAMKAWGNWMLFVFSIVFLLITIVVLIPFYNIPCKNRTVAGTGRTRVSMVGAMKILSKNKKYMTILAGMLLVGIGTSAIFTYMSILIQDYGGNASHQGWAIFCLTIGIYPFMILYPTIVKKMNINNVLLVGLSVTVLRILSMAMVRSVWGVVLVQLLEAVAFGLFNPSYMAYITRITPTYLLSSALTLSASVQSSFSGIVCNLFARWYLSFASIQSLYVIYSGVAVVGLFLVFLSTRMPGLPVDVLEGTGADPEPSAVAAAE